MADYATVAQIKGLGIQTDAPATATTVWDDLATGASRMFDKLAEVEDDYFAQGDVVDPVTYSVKNFIGDGTAYLKLPPFIALNPVDPVTINNGTILLPSYSTSNVPEYVAVDKHLVVLSRTTGGYFGSYFDGRNRFTGWPERSQIKVSANWGWSAIPKDVQIATAKIALHNWRISDPVNADNTEAVSEAIIDGLPASVWAIVEKYRRKYSEQFIFV